MLCPLLERTSKKEFIGIAYIFSQVVKQTLYRYPRANEHCQMENRWAIIVTIPFQF